MKSDCAKWKDQLLEAALTGTPAGGLEEHVQTCADCAGELRALRTRLERLDALLPLVARGAEPPAEFRAHLLAAAEAASERKRARPWQVWTSAGATAVVVAALIIGLALQRRTPRTLSGGELAAAEQLAEWRAPSDVLLETPGRDIWQTTPRLGESYLNVPVKMDEEE